MAAGSEQDRTLVIERTFDAPRELVWRTWTEPAHLARWWGPRGFTTRIEELDLRVGGRSRYVMVGPDGKEYPAEGVFREIVPMRKIVTTDEFGEGEVFAGMDLPQGIVLTILFEDAGTDRTKLTLRVTHATPQDKAKHEKMGVVAGWNSSLDCLDDHLSNMAKTATRVTDTELIATRTFDAPPELVWQAWSDPAKLTRWWGPYGFTTTTHDMDMRPGGVWRFTMHGPDGRDYKNKIVYTVVDRPRRLEYHHADDGEVEPVCFATVVDFEPRDGGTHVTMRMTFPTPADFQRVVREYGADKGLRQTVSRLAEFLAETAKPQA